MIDVFTTWILVFAFLPLCILRLATLYEMSTRREVETKGKTGITSTSASETILNSSVSDDTNCACQGVEEIQVEPGPGPYDEDDSISSVCKRWSPMKRGHKSQMRFQKCQKWWKKLLSNSFKLQSLVLKPDSILWCSTPWNTSSFICSTRSCLVGRLTITCASTLKSANPRA